MEALDKSMDDQELISALADGQLRGEALARGVQLAADGPGRGTWHAYCVIGEVLRSGQATSGSAPAPFLARLQARLQQEPVCAAPAQEPAPLLPARAGTVAANDWRWKLVAGFASVAAVAAVGWNVWGSAGLQPAAQPQLAAAPASVLPAGVLPVAAASSAAMIRDPRLDQLLAAHRQFGGATALQSASGFLRNATFEGPAR
jgi:sigma-E factor negative regulatory protein RseA